ncbi:hypothetical protein PRNP1_012923 [Phytophthora ramorum]
MIVIDDDRVRQVLLSKMLTWPQFSFVAMEFTTSVAAPIEQRILDEFLEEMGEFDRQLAKTTPKEQQGRLKPKVLPAEKPRWNRRKEEIERLRAEVQVMETQAAFMRLQAVHAKLYDQCASKGQRLWKAAALKERRRRQAAQRENSELKAKIMCYVEEKALLCHPLKTRSPLTSTASDIVIPSFREMMSSRHQVLDNALLDSKA